MKPAAAVFTLALLAASVPTDSAHAEDWAARCTQDVEKGNIDACQKAVAESPKNPVLRRHYARAMTFRGLYQSAIDQYRIVTQIRPNDARSWYDYGYSLAFARRYKESVQPLEKAIKLNKNYIAALRILAIAYAKQKMPAKVFRTTLDMARSGDRIAQFEVSIFYQEAYGVARDDGKSLQWLVKAAESGHIGAMDRLVRVYQNGALGQAKSDRKAEFWAIQARRAREN